MTTEDNGITLEQAADEFLAELRQEHSHLRKVKITRIEQIDINHWKCHLSNGEDFTLEVMQPNLHKPGRA